MFKGQIQQPGTEDGGSSRGGGGQGYQQLPYTESHKEGEANQNTKSRKKWYIGGAVLLALIIVIIVISVTVGGGGGDKPGPGPAPGPPPNPPAPPVPKGFNPYKVENDVTLETSVNQVTGILLYTGNQPPAENLAEIMNHKRRLREEAPQLFEDEEPVNEVDVGIESQTVVKSVGVNNDFIRRVRFTIGQGSYKRTVISFRDEDDEAGFDIPDEIVPRQNPEFQFRLDMVDFQYQMSPFSFSFNSTRTGNRYLDTFNQTFVFQKKFIQIDMNVGKGIVYGFGSRLRGFHLGRGAWTMWSMQDQTEHDDGTGGKQLAGMHPFALVKLNDEDEFFGIFFRNTNAQSPIISHRHDSHILSYVTTGGNLDIIFFGRGTAREVISNYQRFIGLPKLPPFWALGWHGTSKMWYNLTDVQKFTQDYQDHNIPLESLWLDGENYMDRAADFTVDPVKFAGLPEYTEALHSWGKKLVLMLFPGLSDDQPSKYVTAAEGSLITGFDGSLQAFSAPTFTNDTKFLDWFHKGAKAVWQEGLYDLFTMVAYDGLWLDWNTPTIFCNGGHPCPGILNKTKDVSKISKADTTWYRSYGPEFQDTEQTYYLPFIPQYENNLDYRAISLNATHYYSKEKKTFTEYDVHPLFGHMQSKETYKILSENSWYDNENPTADLRKFISSTSTFAGTGQFAQHILTGQRRSWDHLRWSIASVMNFNMFGIPFTGAEVCGARPDSSNQSKSEQQEICARWYQLSTFYPLARIGRYEDSNSTGIGIDPWDLPSGDLQYDQMAQYAIKEKYAYARFVYECLFAASQEGRTCFDPLMFHYPDVENSYNDIEHTFIVADAVKVSPVLKHLEENETFHSFFPQGDWVDLDTHEVIKVKDEAGEDIKLTPTISVKKHLRPGYMVPVQFGVQGGQSPWANSTEQLAYTDIIMKVNRNNAGYASGKLFLDDGKNISEIETTKTYEYFEFKLVNKSIQKLTINTDGVATGRQGISSFVIMNAKDLEESTSACFVSSTGRKVTQMAAPVYDKDLHTLTLKAENGTIDVHDMESIHFNGPNDRYNLCDMRSQGWYVESDTFNQSCLNTSKCQLKLITDKVPLQDETMHLELNLGNKTHPMVRVRIYREVEFLQFQVPKDIVDVSENMGKCGNHPHCKLGDYVVVDTSKDAKHLITVKSRVVGGNTTDGTVIWQLDSLIEDDYLNAIKSTALTRSGDLFQGIMGLAERTSNDLFIKDGVISLWSRDEPNPVETGKLPASNAYGVHPFYMAAANDSSWFGVYTNLAAAQDWWIENNNSTGEVHLTTIASGGIADIVIMAAPTPEKVTEKYQDLVGRPLLTPMWALGWHQCKWGYESTDALKANVNAYKDNNLPLDAQWVDIDWMYDYRNFEYNKVDFAGLPDFVDELHQNHMHFVPILDAGIAQREGGNYTAYNDGVEKDVFMKAYQDGPIFTGEVWPVDAVYPDFTLQVTKDWWHGNLDTFHKEIKFDGLWLDMNEASNFCNGVCYRDQLPLPMPLLKQMLPYTPTGRDLETKSIALDAINAKFKIEGEEMSVPQLDAHSLFGTMEVHATHSWFKKENKRAMIIERSAFAGMGKWGSRWLGDNFSQYEYMGYSVTGIMMHNILGIPLAGADICGFIGDTTPELCTRWYQVGAFYPFSRNHNNLNQVPQEPYVFNYPSTQYPNYRYTDFMRKAMQTKMAFINYYYTEMSHLHETGGAFYSPLFFHFPDDKMAYDDYTHNVMLGKHLKVSQQSTESEFVTDTVYYFPQGTWCSVVNASAGCINGPTSESLPSRIYQSYVHIRNGSIVPLQLDVIGHHSTTKKVHTIMKNPVDLHIHPTVDAQCSASGRLLVDDGEVLDYAGFQNRYKFNFTANCQAAVPTEIEININRTHSSTNDPLPNDHLGKIVIYNTNQTTFDMTKTYNIEVLRANGTSSTLTQQAKFNSALNQTVFDSGADNITLGFYDIQKMTFKEVQAEKRDDVYHLY